VERGSRDEIKWKEEERWRSRPGWVSKNYILMLSSRLKVSNQHPKRSLDCASLVRYQEAINVGEIIEVRMLRMLLTIS
jgi:hypothetical protein